MANTLDTFTAATASDLDDADLVLVLDGTNPPKKMTRAELVKGLFGVGSQGDILYHNGTTWARLAKGTASQKLQMNSGATAPEWATLQTGGQWELVSANSITATATSYTYTGLSAYDMLMVEFALSDPSTGSFIAADIRVSAGTWRNILTFGSPTGTNDSKYGTIMITNFARRGGARTFAKTSAWASTGNLSSGTVGGSGGSSNFEVFAMTGSDATANDEIRFTNSTAFGAYGGVDGEINIYGLTL